MLRKVLLAVVLVLGVCVALLVAGRVLISRAANGRTYTDVSLIPHRRVGLLLGCPKRVHGWSNPFFENRIAAAAELYQHAKVDYIIASGDNHVQFYDEPVDMKNALVEKGVPANRIYLDYAGFRTLDSIVRAKEIFGQDSVTVVSQNFHNERAIFLAQHHGIEAIGFDATDVPPAYAFKTLLREQFAKTKAVLDVYILNTQPHFLGQRIVVGRPEGEEVSGP
jgi:SanA protein